VSEILTVTVVRGLNPGLVGAKVISSRVTDQLNAPCITGSVENALSILDVFIGSLKWTTMDAVGAIAVESCAGEMAVTTGSKGRASDSATKISADVSGTTAGGVRPFAVNVMPSL
jgi:hypothetical protein